MREVLTALNIVRVVLFATWIIVVVNAWAVRVILVSIVIYSVKVLERVNVYLFWNYLARAVRLARRGAFEGLIVTVQLI